MFHYKQKGPKVKKAKPAKDLKMDEECAKVKEAIEGALAGSGIDFKGHRVYKNQKLKCISSNLSLLHKGNEAD